MYGYIKTKNSNHESLQIKKWFQGKKHEELEFYELTRDQVSRYKDKNAL